MDNPYQSPAEDEEIVVADAGTVSPPMLLVAGMMSGCRAGAVVLPVVFLVASALEQLREPNLLPALLLIAITGGVAGLLFGIPVGGFAAIGQSALLRLGQTRAHQLMMVLGSISWIVFGLLAFYPQIEGAWLRENWFVLLLLGLGLGGGYCGFRVSRLLA